MCKARKSTALSSPSIVVQRACRRPTRKLQVTLDVAVVVFPVTPVKALLHPESQHAVCNNTPGPETSHRGLVHCEYTKAFAAALLRNPRVKGAIETDRRNRRKGGTGPEGRNKEDER